MKKAYYTKQMTLKLTQADKKLIDARAREHQLHPSTMVRIAALRQLRDEEYLDHEMRGKPLHRVFPVDFGKPVLYIDEEDQKKDGAL